MTEDHGLIAPHEVRELLERLTEASIESRRANEPQTLAGLALETGVPVERLESMLVEIRGGSRARFRLWVPITIVLGLLAFGFGISRILQTSAPSVAAKPPLTVTYDDHDLVPLSQVRYGPAEGGVLVDPSFVPPVPLPDGVAISARVGPVLWGAGDPSGRAFPLDAGANVVGALKQDLAALVDHASKQASRRRLPLSNSGGEAGLTTVGSGMAMELSIQTTTASPGVSMRLPAPDADPAEKRRITESGIGLLLERLRFSVKTAEQMRR